MQARRKESSAVSDQDVIYHLRDLSHELGEAWKSAFSNYPSTFKVSVGDIFSGAPAVDAIVSPANSFGFLGGGINLAFSRHFGGQMQERVQHTIRTSYDGELLVGQALILPAYGDPTMIKEKDLSRYNEGKPIKFLISAPTMRVGGMDVSKTPNAFLAFKAVILAVRRHNATPENEPIRTVLVPGLGTAIGKMPFSRCATQMLEAYETFVLGKHRERVEPSAMGVIIADHKKLIETRGGGHTGRGGGGFDGRRGGDDRSREGAWGGMGTKEDRDVGQGRERGRGRRGGDRHF